jgi:hypothetical protein
MGYGMGYGTGCGMGYGMGATKHPINGHGSGRNSQSKGGISMTYQAHEKSTFS